MNVTAIILARGGSEGIPGKNLRYLDGKPLIGHAIGHAKSSELVNRVVVSTDSEHIAYYAILHGAEVPFLRPSHLAMSDTTMIACMKHVLDWLDQHDESPDIILHLKTTIPFREPGIIDRVVRCLQDNPNLDSCFAGFRTGAKVRRLTKDGFEQFAADIDQGASRQDREDSRVDSIYEECAGVACASRACIIRNTGHYIGDKIDIVEITDKTNFIDIDDYYDLWLADKVAKEWNPIKGLSKSGQDEALVGYRNA